MSDPERAPVLFVTREGVTVPALTREQMREVDRIATEETGPTLLQMMENAGRTLAELTLRELGAAAATSTVVVLAGGGSNGAGGICAARHLAPRVREVVLCLARPDDPGEAVALQREVFGLTRGVERPPAGLASLRPDVVLDAIVGYGLSGPLVGAAAELAEWTGGRRCPVLSLDVPSGIDADTGETDGPVVRPHITLALALPKAGLAKAPAGEVWLADIGIPPGVYERAGIRYESPFGRDFVVLLGRGGGLSGR